MPSQQPTFKAVVIDPLSVVLSAPDVHAKLFYKIVETRTWKLWCSQSDVVVNSDNENAVFSGEGDIEEIEPAIEVLAPLKGKFRKTSLINRVC